MDTKIIKSNNPLVSMIIPNWNGKHFLKTCLYSIYQQVYKNFEVIVVDCASNDGSADFIKQNYPKVKLIELKDDKGPTNALNVGINNSKADYILLLNNDVILPPKCLNILVLELQQDEKSVISPIELDWNMQFRRAGTGFSFLKGLLCPFLKESHKVSPFWPLAACCITTKQIITSTPLNEHLFMYEELEWGWRLHLKKIKVKVCFDTVFLHKGEATSKTGSFKQAFYYSRLMISTCFICLKIPTLILLSPLIGLYYLKNGLWIIKKQQWNAFIAYLRGFLDFLFHIGIFINDRRRAQRERLINDWEIIKMMESSLEFVKNSTEKLSDQVLPFYKKFYNKNEIDI
ncbi:MAG: glycosyltransferase family 2 protein [Promethearchaeota archaeon]